MTAQKKAKVSLKLVVTDEQKEELESFFRDRFDLKRGPSALKWILSGLRAERAKEACLESKEAPHEQV